MNAAKLITIIYYYSIIAALTTDYNKRVVLQLSTFERVFWGKVEKYIDNLI